MSLSNLGTPNCCDFEERHVFNIDNNPWPKHGYQYINPYCIQKLYDSSFQTIKNPACSPHESTYVTNDPRLISGSHNGQILTLDRPPLNSSVKLKDVYTNPQLKYYGDKYTDYNSINAGQILYYNDKSIEDPFYTPVFVNGSKVVSFMEKDPMGAYKPYYNRYPLIEPNLLRTRGDTNGELTWIRDSQEFREDIISKQMDKMNKTRYATRWFSNKN